MILVGELLRESRQKLRLSQEEAATMLPFDLRTLQRYEANDCKETPWDALVAIGKAYGDRRLLWECLQRSDLWLECLPQISTGKGLRDAGSAVLDELWDVETVQRAISHIMRDGVVSADEEVSWQMVKARLVVLLTSIMELLVADDAQRRPYDTRSV